MDLLQALALAVLQGATELFPISSLGHAVLLPAVLDWRLDQRSDAFLPFLVLLHTGTAVALLLYFWRDWLALARGVIGLDSPANRGEARQLLLRIIAATLPAVILGFVANRLFHSLFAAPLFACAFLFLNGILLFAGERLRGRGSAAQRPLVSMSLLDALVIGVWQCGALLPGISRSGATIVGGLLRGFDHEDAARFSFLIALPIILGATVLEVPHLLRADVAPGVFNQALMAALAAGVTAWLAIALLMRYFRDHDDWALNPFAYYCLAVGAAAGLYLGLR